MWYHSGPNNDYYSGTVKVLTIIIMKQIDLVINSIPVVLNIDEDNWTNNNINILKPDATSWEALDIINYLYEEGFISDRRIEYKIV